MSTEDSTPTWGMTFAITFHGPFHVGSGSPNEGLDRVLDRENLLPATSLKGLMRAAATERLGIASALVDAVFGASGHGATKRTTGSPWLWTDARLAGVKFDRTARIEIDDDTGAVSRGFLALGESVWSSGGSFAVRLRTEISPAEFARHRVLLRAAARAVTALGGERRRGEGWVTITDSDAWTPEDTQTLVGMRAAT